MNPLVKANKIRLIKQKKSDFITGSSIRGEIYKINVAKKIILLKKCYLRKVKIEAYTFDFTRKIYAPLLPNKSNRL